MHAYFGMSDVDQYQFSPSVGCRVENILYPIKVECQVSCLFWDVGCRPIFSPSVGCQVEKTGNVGCQKIPLHGTYTEKKKWKTVPLWRVEPFFSLIIMFSGAKIVRATVELSYVL